MNKVLAKDLGFLGINVDSNFDLAWLKTEVADKIREGDITSIYKLINFARHSEDPAIRDYAVKIANLYEDKVEAYSQFPEKKEETEVVYEEAASIEEINDLLSSDEPEVNIEITEDLKLDSSKSVVVEAGKKATIKVDGTIECVQNAFDVRDGGELVLTGDGTLKSTTKSTKAAINASGKDARVVVDGITIDTITTQGKEGNNSYGIYLKDDASVDFKSGTIKTAYGSCISTNNTTNGATEINISGGELLCDGSYAIYLPSQATVNITGGKVQGINARMGIFNISGNAEIIPTTINETGYDDIGKEFATSGCVWLGDTIAVMAGTYTDVDGTDCEINVFGDATVKSNFRSAVGIYKVDTKASQNVSVNVMGVGQVSTTADGYDNIKVYDHDYITSAAIAAGKTYNATVDSIVSVKVGNEVVYPVSA